MMKSAAIARPIQQWADKINAPLGQAAEAVIEVGRQLIAAKAALKHGEWEQLFQGHPEAVKAPVRFSVRTAQTLMQVAKHPVLSKAQHVASLPPSWGTLYELTKVPAKVLMAAFTDGTITPDMERRQVRALLPEPATDLPAAEPDEWSYAVAANRLNDVIDRELAKCPEEKRLAFVGILHNIASMIGGAS